MRGQGSWLSAFKFTKLVAEQKQTKMRRKGSLGMGSGKIMYCCTCTTARAQYTCAMSPPPSHSPLLCERVADFQGTYSLECGWTWPPV